MTLNELFDALQVEFVSAGKFARGDYDIIKNILIGCAKGNRAARIKQIQKINAEAYAFILGFLGGGDAPAYIDGETQIGIGAGGKPVHAGSVNGDMWFDKDSGETYVWYISDWVQVGR